VEREKREELPGVGICGGTMWAFGGVSFCDSDLKT
jgi:hypothetical protein